MNRKSWRRIASMVFAGFALFVLWFSVAPRRIKGNTQSATQGALKDLTLGIKNYQVEYNRYPNPPDSVVDQRFESTGKLIDVLLGRNVDGMNPREIAYIEPPMFQEGRGGLIMATSQKEDRLVDKWGHPYVIWIDGNHNNKIANPDVKNSSPLVNGGASPYLFTNVLVCSRGPDGIEGTEDDIVSWRGPLKSESVSLVSGFATWESVIMVIVLACGVALIIGMATRLDPN